MSCLYVRSECLKNSLKPLTHHFLTVDGTSYMLQPGCPGYELPYGCTGVLPYLLSLSSTPSPSTEANVKGALDEAFIKIENHEHELIDPLLAYLRSKKSRGVLIVGDEEDTPSRVPTISFVVRGDKPIPSKEVVSYFDKLGGVSSLTKCLNNLPTIRCVGWYSLGTLLCVWAGVKLRASPSWREWRRGQDLPRSLQHRGRRS